jgi:chorismate dehydratase
MAQLRIGAVGYLNARPLTWALDREPDRWLVRYDVPSVCAALLHDGSVDLGLIPSIEYLSAPDYRLVPGIGIGSRGAVASVALYTRTPIGDVTSIALDTSSRTSVTLIQVLCRHLFGIAPRFVPHGPDLAAMTSAHDAGLLIGDPAFDVDHEALGLHKIDLGDAWLSLTGKPFIYAAWTGRPGAANGDVVGRLQAAQAEGLAATDAIAAEYGRGDRGRTARAARYLRDNVKYSLGSDEAQGLQMFLDYAADMGLAPRRRPLEFFET